MFPKARAIPACRSYVTRLQVASLVAFSLTPISPTIQNHKSHTWKSQDFGIHLAAYRLAAAERADSLLKQLEDQLRSGDKRAAAKSVQQFLQSSGDNPKSRSALGMLFAQHGYYSEAAAQFNEAHKQAPQDYDISYNLALALYRGKEYQRATEVLKQAIARQDRAELHSLLADVYEGAGQFLEAAHEYEKAVDLDPQNESNWFDLAYDMLRHRTYDGALSTLIPAVGRFPRSFRLRLSLGAAYFGRRQIEEAVQSFLEATNLDPRSEIGYRFLGAACSLRGSYGKEVAERFKTFSALQPANPWGYYLYGLALQEGSLGLARNQEKVAELYRRAISLSPNFAEAHERLGETYARQGKLGEAVGQFESAIALRKDWSDPHYQLARAYVRLGEKTKAQTEFELQRKLQAAEQSKVNQRIHQIDMFIIMLR
jgi:tetratricopeptide (TPR) repeat protein